LALLVTGFLLALATGDRILARVKLPRVYGSCNNSALKYELYEQTPNPPDVVFVGCSYELFGICCRTVDEEASRELGRPVHSLNLANAYNSTLTDYLLVRRMLESNRPRPKLVYLGISEQSANAANTEWLTQGLRALGDTRDLPLAWAGGPALLGEGLLVSTLRSYRHWSDCRLIVERVIRGAPLRPAKDNARLDAQGSAEWTGDLTRGADRNYLRGIMGWYARQTPGFAPGNPNDLALHLAVQELRAAGIQVRLLEMPLGSIVDEVALPETRAAYLAYRRGLERNVGDALLRIPRGLVDDADFFDGIHLTPNGARKVSRWLAADVAASLRHTCGTEGARRP